MQTVFSTHHNDVQPIPDEVYGVIPMASWAITLVVSLKYVALVMRADNDGEGGILALVHLLREKVHARRKLSSLVLLFGIIGAGLFYGDSVITPAISVMSAIEGLSVANPALEEFVLPLSIVILTVLFAVQRSGTEAVGKAFGPVMVCWFGVLAALGIPHIAEHPAIIRALSPHHAVLFVADRPGVAFIAIGAVVLTITGAEALYADMGHFGARPIRWSWFAVVYPALTINYLGQGAMIINDPATAGNPFFRMAPAWATLPLVVLATLATVIASQAVISGAFSVSRQATRLGLLPRLKVMTTWRTEHNRMVARRAELEGPLEDFLQQLQDQQLPRVPGLAVFPHPNRLTTPLALRRNVAFNRVLHEHVVIVSIVNENVPHIKHVERVEVTDLGDVDDGVVYLSCRVGFNDSQDVPKALALAIEQGRAPELEGLRETDARYFLSASLPREDPKASFNWRRKLFVWLSHNAADGADVLRLPENRTVVVGAQIDV